MLWLLDDPYTVGEMIPDAPAGELTHCEVNLRGTPNFVLKIIVTIKYGWVDSEGEFVQSPISPVDRQETYVIAGSRWRIHVREQASEVRVNNPGNWVPQTIGQNTIYKEPLARVLRRAIIEYLLDEDDEENPGNKVLPAGTAG